MWIKQIDLTNFRSYISGSLELSRGINLVVGQNNSGKSTLLKSIAWLQTGFVISDQDIRKFQQNASIRLVFKDFEKYFSQCQTLSPVILDEVEIVAANLSASVINLGGTSGIVNGIYPGQLQPNYAAKELSESI